MNDLKIYSVSDRYIAYLQQFLSNVYSNKEQNRTHTRKYIGVVLCINDFHYYIPMSSPKPSDYQIAGDGKVIKKSIVPIIRIVVKNKDGVKELKGTLRISHMIPVPETELELYDIDHEDDTAYRDLVRQEYFFIRNNQQQIIKKAAVMYKQKISGDTTAGYVRSALPFKELEQYCLNYCNKSINNNMK